MKSLSSMSFRLLPVMLLVVACSEPSTPAGQAKAPAAAHSHAPDPKDANVVRVPAVAFGQPFPAGSFTDLNPASGTGGKVNFADSVGKRPVIFLYWIAGRPRSEKMLQDLERIVEEAGPGKAAIYGIVRERPGSEIPMIVERIKAMGVHAPVLHDPDFVLGQQLSVRSVPALAILDAEGTLRLTNGGSLQQVLEYNMDLEAAVRRVTTKGAIGTYGILPRYEPVSELIGKKSPDFEAQLLGPTGTMRRWSSLIDPKRLNVLVFWSVDCPHCKKSLPEINNWLKQHPGEINVVTAASIPDDAARVKTEEYVRLSQFVFTTVIDRGLEIGELYQVTSTPTILLIRPDGVVDSVLLADADFAKAIVAKTKELNGKS